MSEDGKGYMTEERRMIRDAAREFTMKEVLPVANRLDGPDGEIPMELRQKMADMGYFGIMIPEEHGGLGLGYLPLPKPNSLLKKDFMNPLKN